MQSYDVPPTKGPLRQIDDAWRIEIKARMDELHMLPIELCRRTGASKSHISDVLSLKRGKTSSQWVDAIHMVLGLEPPGATISVKRRAGTGPRSYGVTADLTAVRKRAPSPRFVAVTAPSTPTTDLPPSAAALALTSRLNIEPTAATSTGLRLPPPPRPRDVNADEKRRLVHTIIDALDDDFLDAWLDGLIGSRRS